MTSWRTWSCLRSRRSWTACTRWIMGKTPASSKRATWALWSTWWKVRRQRTQQTLVTWSVTWSVDVVGLQSGRSLTLLNSLTKLKSVYWLCDVLNTTFLQSKQTWHGPWFWLRLVPVLRVFDLDLTGSWQGFCPGCVFLLNRVLGSWFWPVLVFVECFFLPRLGSPEFLDLDLSWLWRFFSSDLSWFLGVVDFFSPRLGFVWKGF